MRGWFLKKVNLITIFNCPVILRCFFMQVNLILSEPTQFKPTLNRIFGQFSVSNLFLTTCHNNREPIKMTTI